MRFVSMTRLSILLALLLIGVRASAKLAELRKEIKLAQKKVQSVQAGGRTSYGGPDVPYKRDDGHRVHWDGGDWTDPANAIAAAQAQAYQAHAKQAELEKEIARLTAEHPRSDALSELCTRKHAVQAKNVNHHDASNVLAAVLEEHERRDSLIASGDLQYKPTEELEEEAQPVDDRLSVIKRIKASAFVNRLNDEDCMKEFDDLMQINGISETDAINAFREGRMCMWEITAAIKSRWSGGVPRPEYKDGTYADGRSGFIGWWNLFRSEWGLDDVSWLDAWMKIFGTY